MNKKNFFDLLTDWNKYTKVFGRNHKQSLYPHHRTQGRPSSSVRDNRRSRHRAAKSFESSRCVLQVVLCSWCALPMAMCHYLAIFAEGHLRHWWQRKRKNGTIYQLITSCIEVTKHFRFRTVAYTLFTMIFIYNIIGYYYLDLVNLFILLPLVLSLESSIFAVLIGVDL